MKKILIRLGAGIVLFSLLLVSGLLITITVTDYVPEEIVELDIINNLAERTLGTGESFTITSFNIGYAGLDRNQDFFMDGGTASRSSSDIQTRTNLAAITAFLSAAASDIYMLQEVDRNSSRSFYMDQADAISQALNSYSYAFAYNYKVAWVPVPLLDPMGKAYSGLMTLSMLSSTSARRFDLPGKESWPLQQLDLDRAFIESRFPVDNGKELVLVNLHLSAFDKEGYIREQQLAYLSSYMKQEEARGNYLVIGGDWNHSLPGTDPSTFPTSQQWPEWLQPFPESFQSPGFQWATDPLTPTVRTLDVAYMEGVNFQAVIDGFLVSPNVEIISVQTTPLGYEHSDHNPVTVELKLK